MAGKKTDKIHLKRTSKNKAGHPSVPIDMAKVDELIMSGCLGTEVAAYFGVHPTTLYKRIEDNFNMNFSSYLAEKRSKGDSILKAHQYAKAIGLTDKGDNTLLVWLGKTRLGQREVTETISKSNIILKACDDLRSGFNIPAPPVSEESNNEPESGEEKSSMGSTP